MDILLDAGYLIDLFAKTERHESAVRVRIAYGKARLHTLWECIAEASHKLDNKGRQAMLLWLAKNATIHASQIADIEKMTAYMRKYANASKGDGADVTDVCLVFLAYKLKTTYIFTVDKADFDTYKTLSGKPFNRLWVKDS